MLVSVIIPCYNHGRFLPDAVASVVAQTLDSWEIVIVDDGSTDDTSAIAERMIARYPERAIRLLLQPNQGSNACRNNGIRAARGAYILPLDADDLIEPEMLEATAAVLDREPEVGFVYTDVRMFGDETRVWSGGPYTLEKLRFDSPMVMMTLFRRSAWAAVGGFKEWMHGWYEDWDFWLSLADAGWQGRHVARPLVCYRRSSSGQLQTARLRDLELRAQIVLNHTRLYPPAFVRWARATRAPQALVNGALRSRRLWLRAFAGYVLLVALHYPRLVPKTLARPLFCRLSARQQGYARSLARALRLTQAQQ